MEIGFTVFSWFKQNDENKSCMSSCLFRDKIKTKDNKRKTEVERKVKPQGNKNSLADNLPKIFTEVFNVKCIYH